MSAFKQIGRVRDCLDGKLRQQDTAQNTAGLDTAGRIYFLKHSTTYYFKLLLKKKIERPDNKQIAKALGFTRNILTNKFFLPTNMIFPKSRIILENYFN